MSVRLFSCPPTETELLQLFDRFARSMGHRDVAQYRFDNGDHVIDAYQAGGLSRGDDPTDAYSTWDTIFDTVRLPDTWPNQIGAAAGLLHPHGAGPATTTVTFHAWA